MFLLLSGCDRQKYHERRDKLEETHKTRVQSLIDNWRMSEKRYKLLKSTDEDQAAGSISCKLCRFGCFACLKIIQLELGWKTLFKILCCEKHATSKSKFYIYIRVPLILVDLLLFLLFFIKTVIIYCIPRHVHK